MKNILAGVIGGVLAAVVILGIMVAAGGETLGVTNFDDLTLSGDLVTGDDATIGDDINVTGDLKIGNGSPSLTLNNEDAYVEGTFENDGGARFDGAVAFNGAVTGTTLNDLDGGPLYMDGNQSTIQRAQTNGLATYTLPATGTLSVLVGNMKVGNGSPTVSQDGEDSYFEGQVEVDGEAQFDGAIDANGTVDFAAAVVNNSTLQQIGAFNLDGATDLDGVITNAANLEHILFPTYATASFTYTAGAGGTVPLFTVGAGEKWLVHDIRVNVTTNFAAVGDDALVHIGDSNDTDGFCVLADAELQTTDTEGTGWLAGWQCQVAATRGVYIDGTGGFIYDGAETIDAVISAAGNDLSTGAATVYLVYTRLQ